MEETSEEWAVETILGAARPAIDGLAGVLASRAASGTPQADDITVMDIRVL